MMRSRILLCVVLALGCAAHAAAPKYSNEFLSVGVGARALGMGNAATATAYDASAAQWNPALLGLLPASRSAALMHAEYFAGIAKFDFAGFAYRLDTATDLAATLVRFGVDNIPNTTDLIDADGNFSYDRMSYFSTSDYAFSFSLARQTSIGGLPLRLGATAKVVYRNVGKFAAGDGFGFDLGAHYALRNWSLGLMLRDITTTVNVWTFSAAELEIPAYVMPSGDTITNAVPASGTEVTLPKVTLALARSFDFGKGFAMLAELGVDMAFDGERNVLLSGRHISFDPKLGVECSYKGMVFLRGGVNNAQRISDFGGTRYFALQPNMGVGLRLFGFSLDYALTNIGSVGVSSYSNVFSVGYNF
jgi:hypothetical protein